MNNAANAIETSCIIVQPLASAYVRPILTDKGKNFAVCSTDGIELGRFATQDAAFYAAYQHDLDPVLLN